MKHLRELNLIEQLLDDPVCCRTEDDGRTALRLQFIPGALFRQHLTVQVQLSRYTTVLLRFNRIVVGYDLLPSAQALSVTPAETPAPLWGYPKRTMAHFSISDIQKQVKQALDGLY